MQVMEMVTEINVLSNWGENMNNNIIIKGAKEHNLKNINLEIPRDKLVVITGLSERKKGAEESAGV